MPFPLVSYNATCFVPPPISMLCYASAGERMDDSIAVAEKSLPYVIGERVLAPAMEALASLGKYVWGGVSRSLDWVVLIPGASAEEVEIKDERSTAQKIGDAIKTTIQTVTNPAKVYEKVISPGLQKVVEKKAEKVKEQLREKNKQLDDFTRERQKAQKRSSSSNKSPQTKKKR